jgi:hypothetical protein
MGFILTVEAMAGSDLLKSIADGTRLAQFLGIGIVTFKFNQYLIECYGNGTVTRIDSEKESTPLMVWEEWNGKSWERRP